MLTYIPDEWFCKEENKGAVLSLLADIPDTDIMPADSILKQTIEKKLSQLGEDIILKHYQEGYFVVG